MNVLSKVKELGFVWIILILPTTSCQKNRTSDIRKDNRMSIEDNSCSIRSGLIYVYNNKVKLYLNADDISIEQFNENSNLSNSVVIDFEGPMNLDCTGFFTIRQQLDEPGNNSITGYYQGNIAVTSKAEFVSGSLNIQQEGQLYHLEGIFTTELEQLVLLSYLGDFKFIIGE